MTSNDLKIAQAKALHRIVSSHLRYMVKLRTRMESLGFPPDDPLYQAVCEAHDGLHAVCVQAHYASCRSGVGKPAKE